MRNPLAYEAYMGFLLKLMFWIAFLSVIAIIILLLIDLAFVLFAPRKKADVIRADIAPIGKKTKLIDAHGIFITYSFNYQNNIYQCQGLNSYGRVTTNGYYRALNILNRHVIDKHITVYTCPFNPNLSIVLPFKGIFALKVEVFMIVGTFLVTAKILGYI